MSTRTKLFYPLATTLNIIHFLKPIFYIRISIYTKQYIKRLTKTSDSLTIIVIAELKQ